jgi:hypothetical protein
MVERCHSCETLKVRIVALKLSQIDLSEVLDEYNSAQQALLDQTNQQALLETANEKLQAELKRVSQNLELLQKAKDSAEAKAERVVESASKLLTSYRKLKSESILKTQNNSEGGTHGTF